MKSIIWTLLFNILYSGVLVISAESSWALNTREKTHALETKLEKKLEEGLMAWMRHLYPLETKQFKRMRAEVTLVPGRLEYALTPWNDDINAYTKYKTIKVVSGIKYQLDVSAEFVRLFETDDALFAYAGILAQKKKIFQVHIKHLLSESLVKKMTEFMMKSGKNPYGYLQFIGHLHSFLDKEWKPDERSKTEELLNRLTGANDNQKYSFQPLSAKLLMKNYLENTMQVVAKKLGVFNQFRIFKVDISENDILDLSISNKSSDHRSLLLRLPRKWMDAFANEDQFVALIIYALLWNQEASKKNGSWGPDSIDILDRKVVDMLLAIDMKKPHDFGNARGYNPKEYFNLLTRIERMQKKFAGLFTEIQELLRANQINPNTRITALQNYLTKLENKHAYTFAETYPLQVFAKKTKAAKSFKAKKVLIAESSKSIAEAEEEILGLPSTITYQEFTDYLSNNQGNPKLDILASQLVKLLPETELTFAILTRFFQDEKNKEGKDNQETRLPISVLTALNTFLSRLNETDLSQWVHWNSVYDLVQNGIVEKANYPIPSRICEEWENNYLKLLSIQIEGTNPYNYGERMKLISNLKDFRRSLGPCSSSSSEDRIFKLLMVSNKVDLALMIEWDSNNSYQNKYKSILQRKGVDDLNFLDSTIFFKRAGGASVLAEKAIRRLPLEVLRIDALDRLDPKMTHESYLRALVRRAAKLHYDSENLLKLYSFISRNPELADFMRYQDRIRMILEVIRHKSVDPREILLPPRLYRIDSEKMVDALYKGGFSHADSLSLILKTQNNADSIERYLDQKPLRSFNELIELLKKISEEEYRKAFAEKDAQQVILQKISEQFPDQEYSVANLFSLQQAVLKIQPQLEFPGLHPLFLRALRVLQDPGELSQVHRIWLETMASAKNDEAEWLMENGSRKDYFKAVSAAIEAQDENLILEYPTFSITEQARDNVFDILMKSALSNEFIQKWIESAFAGKTEKSEQGKKEKFLKQLHEQRPARSLKDVATYLIQGTKVGYEIRQQIWNDCDHLFRTIPAIEFTSDNVKQFISSIKEHSNIKLPISTLAVYGWYLKHTPKENTDQLVHIFEIIKDTQKTYSSVSKTFGNQMESHFGKMVRAAARKDPKLLFDSFTPVSFSKEGKGSRQSSVNWEQELYRIAREEGIDSQVILRLLIHRNQISLIMPFFRESHAEFDQDYSETSSQLVALCNLLSYIDDLKLRDQIASLLIYNVPKKNVSWQNIALFLPYITDASLKNQIAYNLIFNIPKRDVTWENINSFASSFKDGSEAPIYAMVRLLELSEDPYSLAGVHSFLAKYSANNRVEMSSRETCQVFVSNFDKMLKGSFAYGSAYVELKEFTPIQLGCYSGLENDSQKRIEQKYKFRIFMRAAETGAIDREGILIELQDSQFYKSQRKFDRAIAQVKRMKAIGSFRDLETLLIATETRKKGFLNAQITYALISSVPKKDVTWDSVSAFASSFKDGSYAPIYAMLRLLELTSDPRSLAGIHNFLENLAANNRVSIDSQESRQILISNFDKMLKGSFAQGSDFTKLKSFTPIQLECYSDLESNSQKKIEQKYKFRIFMRAAETGAIDREGILIELQDSEFYKSQRKFDRTIEQVKRTKAISSFLELENLLTSIEKRRNGFLNPKIVYELISSVPKKDVTWESIYAFASSFKAKSYAPAYAMLRLLEISEDPHSLAGIHNFLANLAANNHGITCSQEACQVLISNFDKMVKGSFAQGSDFTKLKSFTPIQLGCYSDLESNSQKKIEQKYKFRIFMRAAETGAIDREGILIELQDSEFYKSQRKFDITIEQVKRTKAISSFLELENLLTSIEKRRNGFLNPKIVYELISSVPKKDVTWESIYAFASSFKAKSYAPAYAMLRLLEISEDPHSLAGIHNFLANLAANNHGITCSQEACQVLISNFDKMVKGSFAHGSAFTDLKTFTPIQLGCHSDLYGDARNSIELKYEFNVLMRAAEMGALDREGILIEIHDSGNCKYRRKFEKAIEQVNRMRPINSFLDLENLLVSTEKRKNGFKLGGAIFDQLIDHFPDSEFESDKVRQVLKYLNSYDQRQILSRMAKVTRADEDMDFVIREGGGLALASDRSFEKTMMGSIRQNPENLFQFPILTFAGTEWNTKVLHKDFYSDSFIQNQLIEDWMSSDIPKEYLLAWLRFLPADLGKKDRALAHFIEKAGLRSLDEWATLAIKAQKALESKVREEQWMKDKEHVISTLWNEVALTYLFKSLPSSELSSHQIVEFVKSQSTRELGIDRSYALNWALLKALSTKDYLELHTELLTIRDVAPPDFCKSLEYENSYIAMIKAVMNNDPAGALSFYYIPIAETTLRKYYSEDQAKRKFYAALDTLAENLITNCKHWPSGMAWVWITKYVPVVPKFLNVSGLAMLLQQGPPRLRIEPTEAIIEIASRRGILSFKDIPSEIESAQAIEPNFTLEPQTQKVILERLPKESFTFLNLKSYADIDAVWTKQSFGESILATAKCHGDVNAQEKKTIFELELEKRTDRPDLLKLYKRTKEIAAENPILFYDLENSEKMQAVFIENMRKGGAWPEENLKQQHEILFSLAKRGPSELTDELLYNLYMKPSFKCWSCIEETMQNHAFWDLHRRKEIYEKYLRLSSKAFDQQTFKWTQERTHEYATEIVSIVNLFFPMPSMERSEILEKLANDIKASEKLTEMIEDEKGRGVSEEAVLGLGLYLMNKLLNIYSADEERMALVKFFVRNDQLPEAIALRFRQQVGVNRLRRQFLMLPPYGKALAINALIVNLLPKAAYRKELEHMIWDNIEEENRARAKLFYRSFVKALEETASFQESIFVSFLLGQLANVQGSHPGEKLKCILESLGGTGISIGQKIIQRRIIPDDEILEHLKNMTDHSPLPSRKAIYDRLKILLGVKELSQLLEVQEILGGASTALVVKVLFKDGKEAALKMTFEDLAKRTHVEFRKMETALDYLVEDGGSTYSRLRPVIQEVHDGLKGQEDLTQEQNKTAIMKDLYESRNATNDNVAFKVIQTLSDVGARDIPFNRISSEHVFMELAKGKTLTRLSVEQRKRIFPEIFKKEMSILLADPAKDGMIYFEKDRHMGNFIADFSTMPIRISVYDYPLLSSITAEERNSLFKLIGWLEARRMYGTNLFTKKVIDSKIAELLAREIAEAPLNAGKVEKLLYASLADKAETSEKLFAIFAIVDEVGAKDTIKVRPSLVSYTIALGHAERYGQFVESTHEGGAFREVLKPYILRSDAEFKKLAPPESEAISLETTQVTIEQLSEY